MVKVLVAEENTKEAEEYCLYLSSSKNLKIRSANTGNSALSSYLEIKPHIFIMDSHFYDIDPLEIIDRISTPYYEKQISNILLTTNSDKEQLKFLNVAKVYQILRKPIREKLLLDTVNQMSEEIKYTDFDEREMNILLTELRFVMNSPCTQTMIECIKECYEFPHLLYDLKSLYATIAYHHNITDADSIRSTLRTSLIPLNKNREKLKSHPLVLQFEPDLNISPGRFLDVFVSHLHKQKNHEIFF